MMREGLPSVEGRKQLGQPRDSRSPPGGYSQGPCHAAIPATGACLVPCRPEEVLRDSGKQFGVEVSRPEGSGMSSTRGCNRASPAFLGRSHRSLGPFPLVRREGRQDFILLTRSDSEVIEGPPQLRRDLVELPGGDVEVAVGLFQPEGCAAWPRGSKGERAT